MTSTAESLNNPLPPHTNKTLRAAVKQWLEGGAAREAVEDEWGGSITHWNTSNVTDMRELFSNAKAFNQSLAWDTSNVTDMRQMFNGAWVFNQSLAWNTRNVTDMSYMFWEADAFNNGGQPLAWDTRSVKNIDNMFWCAIAFNQPLTWDTRNATETQFMFIGSCGRLDSSPTAIAATLAASDARRAAWDVKYAREFLLSRRCLRWGWHWRRVAAERSYGPEGVGRKRDRDSFEDDFRD